jgi:hypothetical protein
MLAAGAAGNRKAGSGGAELARELLNRCRG